LWEAHHSVRGITRILAWRVPVHRGARPFSFPSGRVLGEDTAVGWEVQWGWREGVGGWQGRRRGEAARGGVLSLEREARTRESRVAWRVLRGARPILLSVRSSPWRGHGGWLGGAVRMARGGGWVAGEAARGGGEGGRRCECFLLSAKREQEKDKWRGECFAARAPFSFPSGRVLGEDTAVGWEVRW